MNQEAVDAFTAEISECLEAGELMYEVRRFDLALNNTVFSIEVMTAMGSTALQEGRKYNVCLLGTAGQVYAQGFGESVEAAMRNAGIRSRLAEFRRTGLL